MDKRLWFGASALTVGLFAMKQYLWNEVSGQVVDLRAVEHTKAYGELNAAYVRAKQFTLPPIAQADLSKIQHLKGSDISKITSKESASSDP